MGEEKDEKSVNKSVLKSVVKFSGEVVSHPLLRNIYEFETHVSCVLLTFIFVNAYWWANVLRAYALGVVGQIKMCDKP